MILPLVDENASEASDILNTLAIKGAPKEMYIMILEKLEELQPPAEASNIVLSTLINMVGKGKPTNDRPEI